MTKAELVSVLPLINHSIKMRNHYTQLFMANPEDMPLLLEITFEQEIKLSFKAAWILEFICQKDLTYLLPHLNTFVSGISHISHDSAKRPLAKICEMIAVARYEDASTNLVQQLKNEQKEQIIACCFDWMIQKEKVAVKAYAMSTLYLFGKEFKWIHQELRMILEKDYALQSAAFKARARQILKKIKAS
jgi:hypothetical protein